MLDVHRDAGSVLRQRLGVRRSGLRCYLARSDQATIKDEGAVHSAFESKAFWELYPTPVPAILTRGTLSEVHFRLMARADGSPSDPKISAVGNSSIRHDTSSHRCQLEATRSDPRAPINTVRYPCCGHHVYYRLVAAAAMPSIRVAYTPLRYPSS